jgi:hypothetical protein
MSYLSRAGLAGAIAATLLASMTAAAGAVTVSVRIVGDGVGIERTVDTTSGAFGPESCAGDSAGGAIDKAVDGNWDQRKFVSTILGETHTYGPTRDYWNFWINDTYSSMGICDRIVVAGDRVLMLVQRDSATSTPTVFPLALSDAPKAVVAGASFTVTVKEMRTDGTTTTPSPAAGVTVAGGGASAQTDAQGRATLVLTSPGSVELRATRSGNVASDAARVDVAAPPPAGQAQQHGVPVTVTTRDTTAPGIRILGIANGKRFARGKGPRRIRAVVDSDPSGLLATKLRLTRSDRDHCAYYSGKFERFRPMRCGAGHGGWFAVGDRERIDYLLPSALKRGRYVLDVNAIDKAYNRDDARRRGVNRIVFHVG